MKSSKKPSTPRQRREMKPFTLDKKADKKRAGKKGGIANLSHPVSVQVLITETFEFEDLDPRELREFLETKRRG